MSVRPVKRNQRPSDCDWVTVREVVNRQTQLLDLFLRKDDQDLSYKEDPAWDANLSRIYREHPRNLDRPRRVQARLDQTGRWLPIDRNLIDLLIFLADRRWTYIKLAFINEVDDPNNRSDEKFYRFSFRPGENYLIPESQFTPEAIELLRETLQTYGDTQGLLVTLYPVAFNSSVCLALYENADAQVYMFDDCNLRWKNIASSTWLAVRDRNRWYIPLEGEDAVPGFPDRIYVHWEDGTRPKDNVDQAEFDVTGWNEKDQRSQLVHGRSVYLNRVHPDGNNFELFYNRLNNLQTGHVLCLGTQKSKPTLYPDGTFSYRTTELLPVRVDLESASMLPILADELIPLVTNRMAEVRSFRWNPVTEPPLFDTYQLPQELLDQKEITGFFTEVPRLDQEASLCKVYFHSGMRSVCR